MRHLNPYETRVLGAVREHHSRTALQLACQVGEDFVLVESALGALQRGGLVVVVNPTGEARYAATAEGHRHGA